MGLLQIKTLFYDAFSNQYHHLYSKLVSNFPPNSSHLKVKHAARATAVAFVFG